MGHCKDQLLTIVVIFPYCLFYRALYFTAYSQAKQYYNGIFTHESPLVHLSSAITAGVCVCVCVCVHMLCMGLINANISKYDATAVHVV